MTHLPPPETPVSTPIDPARRKLGLGLGASAIFTLASRPVLAGQCMTASAAASGNLSQHGPVISCTGKTPTQWAAELTDSDVRNVSFHTPPPAARNGVFPAGARANWNNSKLRTVMNAADNSNTGSTPNPVSKEFAAALLNIRAGLVPASVLTDVQLIGMWNDWLPDGIFNPKAGANWDANHIVAYLQTLQA